MLRKKCTLYIYFIGFTSLAFYSSAFGGQERIASPAVVNPVVASSLRETLSLDGEWDFATDPQNIGQSEHWFHPNVDLPGKTRLQVPGCWESQGVGGSGMSTAVSPERSIRPLRGSYTGSAWYKKTVTLPPTWGDKKVWIKIGGIHAQGWLWINGDYIAHVENFCGTYKYDITDLATADQPLYIAVLVRNDVPGGKGLMAWIHRFGGIYRSVELEATADVLVDYAYVDGDFDTQTANVHAMLYSFRDLPIQGVLKARAEIWNSPEKTGYHSMPVTLNPGKTQEVVLPVSLDPFRPWSPEHPNLYLMDIVFCHQDREIDGWKERFGVKKWETRKEQFYLNNHPYFVRGYGDDCIYPITLCSPACRDEHIKHLQLARSYGFSYVRLHTHCEVPEFFEACDEVGIMVQSELPYYGMRTSANAEGFFRPKEDIAELVAHYRRYVSLSTYCTGNEGRMETPLDEEMYQLGKQLDPSRLFLHQDGGQNTPENSDFSTGPYKPWQPDDTEFGRPFFAHEYLNLAVDEDPRLESQYTGAVCPPVTADDFRNTLQSCGLSWPWAMAALDAGQQLQRIYQKRGLEQARLDPKCGGYIFWTIVDVGCPSAQGLFDPFWNPKASDAEFFRQFNAPVALLAKINPPESILTEGDSLDVEWRLSPFGEAPIENQTLEWKLVSHSDILARGQVHSITIENGDPQAVGNSLCVIPPMPQAVKAQLIADLPGTDIRNSWDLWLFPKIKPTTDFTNNIKATRTLLDRLKDRYPDMGLCDSSASIAEADIVIVNFGDPIIRRILKQGKKVLAIGLPGRQPGVQLGWWKKKYQTGTAIAAHPAFGDFPHEGYLDPSLFRIVDGTVSLNDPRYQSVEPLMVGGGCEGYLLYTFQAQAGGGKLLATGLDLLADLPEARYLLDQMIRYVQSEQFQPKGTFGREPSDPSDVADQSHQKPRIIKRGTIDRHLAETTPVVFDGKLYRFEYLHKEYWGNTTGDTCFRFVDVESGQTTPIFALGYHTGCAYTEGDSMYVLGTDAWGGEKVDMFCSKDIVNWQQWNVLNLPGYKIYNTSLCKAQDKYMLMYEIGASQDLAGHKFTALFAESKNLHSWHLLPPECNYAKDRYTAPHCLRYLDGYYYNFYLESFKNPRRFHTYVVRSRDLVHWQSSPLNPVLAPSKEDLQIFNDRIPEDQRNKINSEIDCNNSDIDFCDYQGRLVIYYAWGNQNGEEFLAEAFYDGSTAQFLSNWFPEIQKKD